MNGGRIFGLTIGTLLDVYPPESVSFDQQVPVAKVEISEIEDFEARGVIIDGGPIDPLSRATVDSVKLGSIEIPIFVRLADRGHRSLSEIRTRLDNERHSALILVEQEDDARVIVSENRDALTIQSDDLVHLAKPIPLSEPDHVEQSINLLQDLTHWMVVRDLKNAGSNLKVELDVKVKGANIETAAPFEVIPGAILTLRARHHESEGLYIYILDISTDGSIVLLHGDSQERLSAGKVIEFDVEMFLPEGLKSVTDTFKVIATTQPINPWVFPQGSLRNAPRFARGSEADPLEDFLAQTIRGDIRNSNKVVKVKSWATAEQEVTVRRPETIGLSGFDLHIDEAPFSGEDQPGLILPDGVCADTVSGTNSDESCLSLVPTSEDQTVWELIFPSSKRGTDQRTSIGEAFDRAYTIQEQSPKIVRVEPQFEAYGPGLVDSNGYDTRSSVFNGGPHDIRAGENNEWSLTQIRATDAWQILRGDRGAIAGSEAHGVLVAHTDTGYLRHPENWEEVAGSRPIDPSKGYDYYDDDSDPLDPLLDSLPLDTAGHGTASGSVIVSPNGCQLQGMDGCVSGVAPGAQLIPLRVHRTVSQLETSHLAKAIRQIADGKVEGDPKLISIAMGGPPSLSLWKAVRKAEDSGILTIAAAGNYVKTVVWPARFRSTIAVAATNISCVPWRYSSRGDNVDISAPGESVWHAAAEKDKNGDIEFLNRMGHGTTFATGNTSGAAALWLAYHRNHPKLVELIQDGRLTETFRWMLERSAWNPAAPNTEHPIGTHCADDQLWDANQYGPGILDVAALLKIPLTDLDEGRRAIRITELSDIPLFSSLYPDEFNEKKIRSDYQLIFGIAPQNIEPDLVPPSLANFETEMMHHYTYDEQIQNLLDQIVDGDQRSSDQSFRVLRESLRQRDLSERFRSQLGE